MMTTLKGSRSVVTGASSGIGAEYARQLAALGSDLILAARRLDRLEALASELESACAVKVECVVSDLSDPDAPKRLFEQATAEGRKVHVLVNCAGVGAYGPFVGRPLERHLNAIQINATAVTELSYRFARHMLEHGETSYVANIASLAAFQSTPNFAVYSATKSFVLEFSETLQAELEGGNVSVTCVCPGGTYTEFLDQAGQALTKKGHSAMMSAADVARIGIHGMLMKRAVVVPGAMNKLASFLPRLIPRRWALLIARKAMGRAVKQVED